MGIVKQKLDTNSQKGLRKILQEANETSSCLERVICYASDLLRLVLMVILIG